MSVCVRACMRFRACPKTVGGGKGEGKGRRRREVCLHAVFPGERCIGGEQRRINQEVVVCISECIWRHSKSMGTGGRGREGV